MADVCNYYGGYKFDDVENMCIERFNQLVKLMNINKAREKLKLMEIAMYGARMNEKSQKKLHKKTYTEAIPKELRQHRAVSTDQLKGIYGLGSVEDIIKGNK